MAKQMSGQAWILRRLNYWLASFKLKIASTSLFAFTHGRALPMRRRTVVTAVMSYHILNVWYIINQLLTFGDISLRQFETENTQLYYGSDNLVYYQHPSLLQILHGTIRSHVPVRA
jgi:hypothetical protein